MSGPSWLLWLLALAGLVLLGWLGKVSVQSFLQAWALRRRPAGPLRSLTPGILTIRGDVRVTDPVTDRRGLPCLWYRCIVRELRGSGKHRRWATVSDEKKVAGYVVAHCGEEVDVLEEPTEVHGTESSTEREGGFFERQVSIREIWLPILPKLTVLGRYEMRGGRPVLVRDGKLGLLITSEEPDAAARAETTKGILGLAGVFGGLVGGIWFLAR